MRIVPAILATTEDELRSRVALVDGKVEEVHFDVMDGAFVQNSTATTPELVQRLEHAPHFSVHLMVNQPESLFQDWIAAGAHTIFPHVEALVDPQDAIDSIQALGARAGLAVKPETSLDSVLALEGLDAILLMGNQPGFSGKPMLPETVERVRLVRSRRPDILIAVDIGVNVDTAPSLIAAGVNDLVVGSYLFTGDFDHNLEKLKQTVR